MTRYTHRKIPKLSGNIADTPNPDIRRYVPDSYTKVEVFDVGQFHGVIQIGLNHGWGNVMTNGIIQTRP